MAWENAERNAETEKRIMEVVKSMGINRMPSYSETIMFTNGHSLARRIMKSGGFKTWAKRLQLKLEVCETYFGDKYEKLTKEYLNKIFTTVERTPTKFPYDILVNNRIKIDVKASRPHKIQSGTWWYSFNLESKYPKSDFYVVYCVGDNDEVEKVLVIPSFVMTGKKHLAIGKCSAYDIYSDRWDLIQALDEAMDRFTKTEVN